MEGLGVNFRPAWTRRPSFPIGNHLLRDSGAQLLLQCLVSLSLFVAANDPRYARQLCTNVVVVFAGLSTPDKARFLQNLRQVIQNIAYDVLPVALGRGEVVTTGSLALVDRQDAAVACDLLGIEVLELSALWRSGILFKSVLTCRSP